MEFLAIMAIVAVVSLGCVLFILAISFIYYLLYLLIGDTILDSLGIREKIPEGIRKPKFWQFAMALYVVNRARRKY